MPVSFRPLKTIDPKKPGSSCSFVQGKVERDSSTKKKEMQCCKSMLYAEVFNKNCSCWNDQVQMIMSSYGWQSRSWWIINIHTVGMAVRTLTMMTTRITTAFQLRLNFETMQTGQGIWQPCDFTCLNYIFPWKLTYPRKIDGWKWSEDYFPLEMAPFQVTY